MSDKDNPQDVIDSYRKRQERAQRTPVILFVLFALLVIVGGGLLIFWLTGADTSAISMDMLKADTETPTPTMTVTPSATLPPTATATDTATPPPPTKTPEPTLTATRSGAVIYTVNEGDTFFSIAESFGLDFMVLIEFNKDRRLTQSCAWVMNCSFQRLVQNYQRLPRSLRDCRKVSKLNILFWSVTPWLR